MKTLLVVLLLLVSGAAACASASGYDPKRYGNEARDKPDADVDTQALPAAPKTKIPDPKGPLATPAASGSAPQP